MMSGGTDASDAGDAGDVVALGCLAGHGLFI